jgi:hypothetical protein
MNQKKMRYPPLSKEFMQQQAKEEGRNIKLEAEARAPFGDE